MALVPCRIAGPSSYASMILTCASSHSPMSRRAYYYYGHPYNRAPGSLRSIRPMIYPSYPTDLQRSIYSLERGQTHRGLSPSNRLRLRPCSWVDWDACARSISSGECQTSSSRRSRGLRQPCRSPTCTHPELLATFPATPSPRPILIKSL